jgi:L-lactate dehydrogenase complex protein LldG
MSDVNTLCGMFEENAAAVSAVVSRIKSMNEAFAYAVDHCRQKEACPLLASGCGEALSPPADVLCAAKQQKRIAAPGLPAADRTMLAEQCKVAGIGLVTEGLRHHLAGIDIGFTVVDYGIAETGTLVLHCADEDLRIATMVSEVHIAVLPVSRIRLQADELVTPLKERMTNAPDYTAFITGASRTADIERVLALGVHGPLELHVLLMEN